MAIRRSLSSKVDSKGYAQVMLIVEKGRSGKFRMKSGIYAPIAYWNKAKNDISIPRKSAGAPMNELLMVRSNLNKLEEQIESLIRIYGNQADKEFLENTLPLVAKIDGMLTFENVEKVRNNFQEEKKEEETKSEENNIFNLAELFLQKDYSEGRIRMLRVILRSMTRYAFYKTQIEHKPFNWNIHTTSQKDIEGYFTYLKNECTIIPKYQKQFDKVVYNAPNEPRHRENLTKERGNNRLTSMHKGVKTLWNWLIKTKRTTNNPFTGVVIGTEKYGTPFYLTIEERNYVAGFDLTSRPSLEVQRDIFIFQCLVGCRVGDLMHLTQDNIINGVLAYSPHKTKDENKAFVARVPLSEQALSLIEKYKDVDKKHRLFPFISEQRYNDDIKEILTLCKIDRKVSVRNSITGETELKPLYEVASSHMARRTFVGNAYKKVKDPNLIGRMSGHVEGSQAFNRYRAIDDDMLKEVIDAIQ